MMVLQILGSTTTTTTTHRLGWSVKGKNFATWPIGWEGMVDGWMDGCKLFGRPFAGQNR
jgi:hypothetical protein